MPETEDAFTNHRRALRLELLTEARRSGALAEHSQQPGKQAQQRHVPWAKERPGLPSSIKAEELAVISRWDRIIKVQLRRLP